MNILTIGTSPFLHQSEGRIIRDLCHALSEHNHVETIALHHDIRYFLSNETGEHWYDYEDGKRLRVHPFTGLDGSFVPFALSVMKRVQPDLVISVGDYGQICQLSHLKQQIPSLFKWILINSSGVTVANEHFREQLNQSDYVICTSQCATDALSDITIATTEYIPYGPSGRFEQAEITKDFSVMISAKNFQGTSMGGVLKAASAANINLRLHSNLNDEGDFDIPLLIKRYGLEKKITIPEKFISIREGLSEDEMTSLYRKSSAIVDVSMQSGTALSLLEGMSYGCIPIGIDFGAVGEVVRKCGEYGFSVPYETFIGAQQEEHAVMCVKELADIFSKLKYIYENDSKWVVEAMKKSQEVARFFSKEHFIRRIMEIIDNVLQSEHAIVVDSY